MIEFEANVQAEDDAITRLQSLAILLANGREYDPEFIEACVSAAGVSMSDFAEEVEREIKERVCGMFAAMGYNIDLDNEIEADDSDDVCESDEPQPYNLVGNVPHGTTAVVYHDGRKLGEIKAPSGHFEMQASLPCGRQTVEVLAIDEEGRKLGSNQCTFTVR